MNKRRSAGGTNRIAKTWRYHSYEQRLNGSGEGRLSSAAPHDLVKALEGREGKEWSNYTWNKKGLTATRTNAATSQRHRGASKKNARVKRLLIAVLLAMATAMAGKAAMW